MCAGVSSMFVYVQVWVVCMLFYPVPTSVSAIERDLIQLRQERDSLCKQFQAQMDQRIQSLGYEHSIEKAKVMHNAEGCEVMLAPSHVVS